MHVGVWPIVELTYRRLLRADLVDEVVLATSVDAGDDPLAEWAFRAKCPCYRGSLENVLERFANAAQDFDASHIVRITADCPFIDPSVVDKVLASFLCAYPYADYASNTIKRTYPRGLDVEVFTQSALIEAAANAAAFYEKEHVTPFFLEHPDKFVLLSVVGEKDFSRLRWTVDTPEDLEFVRRVVSLIPAPVEARWQDIIGLLEQNHDLSVINSGVIQKPYR